MTSSPDLAHYYALGRSGLRVSRLALGTMTFGSEWGWGADKDAARQMFDAYVEAGGNFFDTADLYANGASERWLGEFVAERGLRDKAAIATKFGFNAAPGDPNAGGGGRKHMLAAIEGSLKRLGTDYVDLYILHAWDRVTPVEETMRALDDLVRSGKARYVGLSNVPAWHAARAQTIAEARGWETVAALQLEYSLIERGIENEFVDLATRCGMGVMAWSPLAGGLLTGKYRPGESAVGRLETLKGSPNPAFRRLTPRNQAIIAELEAVAKAIGRPMAQAALNWVANRPGVASVIVGATTPAQLAMNLAALTFSLPAELKQRLDAASAPPPAYPYLFFGETLQGMLHGGARVGDKPPGYFPTIESAGPGAGGAA